MALIFLVAPQILPFDFGEETINSGDLTSLTCSISKGDSPIEISWLHQNSTINTEGVSVMKMNSKISMLSIDSARADHAGIYTCIAKNLAGSSSYSAILNVNGTTFCFLL